MRKRVVDNVAVPIVFFIITICWNFWPLRVFFDRVLNGLMHEFGHSFVANLGSQFSMPALFFVAVRFQSERSFFTYLIFLGLFSGAAFFASRNRYIFLKRLFLAFIFIQFFFSFVISDAVFEQLVLLGGLGGEIVLGTLAIVSFYYQFPKILSWYRNRYLFLFIGAASVTCAYASWLNAMRDNEKIPWGSIFWGRDDPHGDLNRLNLEFGWEPAEILNVYVILSGLSIIVIFAHFLYFTLKSINRHPE